MSLPHGLGAIPSPPVGWSVMSLADRFWRRVEKSDACWLWTGDRNRAGYGALRDHNVRRQATAVAWFLEHGEYPADGLIVCHQCDNPRCVRADHLFVGTNGDNSRDMVAKGRHRPPPTAGEQNGRARLSWTQVREIRERLIGRRYGDNSRLAREYGVTEQLISQIRLGLIWKESANA